MNNKARAIAWRRAPAKLGKAWLSSEHGRLRPGLQVDVTQLTHERMVAWIEAPWGLSKRVYCHHLDFGLEFLSDKKNWIPEADPRAHRWLRKVRDELRAGKPPRHAGEFGEMMSLELVERVLRRSGRG